MQTHLTSSAVPGLSLPSSLLILQCIKLRNYDWSAQSREESTWVPAGSTWPVGCAWAGTALICIDNAVLLIAFRELFSQSVSNRTPLWAQCFVTSSG